MNKVIDKGFRSCRFVSTIVKHPVYCEKNNVVVQRNAYHRRTPKERITEDGFQKQLMGELVKDGIHRLLIRTTSNVFRPWLTKISKD